VSCSDATWLDYNETKSNKPRLVAAFCSVNVESSSKSCEQRFSKDYKHPQNTTTTFSAH